ncbi:MAG: hypothetical protein M1832_002654 [Thelocarpon impressellum]|nr:MAG: hypothetical protein M1832_002654 [Thelocarpon impressellum]
MDASHAMGPHRPLQRRLTKMYTETKRSYDTVTEPPRAEITPEMSSLHRRLRIQKDRLITWGLEWSDTTAPEAGDIDESLEREGFTTVVGNVMSSIKEILEEAERMRFSDKPAAMESKSSKPGERWSADDRPRFQDLLHDLTTSIDTLFNLSRSRRRLPVGAQASKAIGAKEQWLLAAGLDLAAAPAAVVKAPFATSASSIQPSPSPSPSSLRTTSSLRIDPSALELPDDCARDRLPPYETIATPSNSRTMGYLRRPHTSTNPWKKDGGRAPRSPVLVEYAPFDPIYSSTGISPSMSRLESLAEALHDSDDSPMPPGTRVLNLVGYFECPKHPRFGLVYELPQAVHDGAAEAEKPLARMAPFTLLSMLQASTAGGNGSVPNLEDRLRLAFGLATTFLHLHTKGVTHRDVTSNNIVFFRTPNATISSSGQDFGCDLRDPFLASFDLFSEFDLDARPDSRPTHIYRHLQDTRAYQTAPHREYRPAFDLYGLGMILLEIGLWMPLSSFWKRSYDLQTFRSRILNIYVKKLGQKCGSAYMRAVEGCLYAADQEAILAARGETINAQWRFYCDVVKRLERCCALDDAGPAPAHGLLPTPQSSVMSSLGEAASQKSASSRPDPMETAEALEPRQAPTSQAITTSDPQDPTASTKTRLKVHPVKLARPQLDEWHQRLLPRLERILEKVLKMSKETFTIDLIGIGETAQAAQPTILVTCSSVGKVKGNLSRHFRYDKNFYDLKVRKGKLRRSCARRLRPRIHTPPRRSAVHSDDDDPAVMNPFYQERPLCGASIGAYKYETDKHHAAVSYGGVVMVDGEPFGMTVHHLLDDSSDDDSDYGEDESPTRSGAKSRQKPGPSSQAGESSWTADSGYEDTYISEHSEEETDYGSVDGDSEIEWLGPDEESDDDELVEPGDAPGIVKGQGSNLVITQPAMDDVDDAFFPTDEDKNEEHLESHRFGQIHASSGIRRWKRNNEKHEIDWALLKVDAVRLQPHNLVQGGKRYCPDADPAYRPDLLEPVSRQQCFSAPEDLYPNQVADVQDLPDLRVHCMGRTSGLQGGTISAAMSSVRVAGRTTPSRSWHVLGNFGVPGDSGAWVVDNEQGRVCGHVLAWCSRNAWAYICPMQILMEDMQRTLPAVTVTLPGADSLASLASSRTQHSDSTDRRLRGSFPDVSSLQITPSSTADVGEGPSSSHHNAGLIRDDQLGCGGGGRQAVMEGRRVSPQMAKG